MDEVLKALCEFEVFFPAAEIMTPQRMRTRVKNQTPEAYFFGKCSIDKRKDFIYF
jgi:hypothetical protein